MNIQPRVPFDLIPLLATLKPDDRAAIEPLCRMHNILFPRAIETEEATRTSAVPVFADNCCGHK
jgi:hypothetical protein